MKTISKVPVVHEDIAIGAGKVIQQRGIDSVEVRQVELSWIFRTADEIRSLNIALYTRVQLHKAGASDEFWYDAASIATDNGTTVLKPDAIDVSLAGRWLITSSGGSSDAIPLSGTIDGSPVTGPIEFENSQGAHVYTMRTDIFGTESFGFLTELNGTNFIIATKDDGGVIQGFSFTEDGQFTIPSNSGSNSEAWQIGAGTVGGDDDVLIFASVDALGGLRTHNAAMIVSPSFTYTFHVDGALYAPRATIAGDDGLVLTTKAYVESILPPGGGEANTTSSPGAGNSLVLTKAGIDLPFKSIVAGTDVTIDVGADTLTINSVAGGGGGLPAGSLNQGLRNDAGTNTYVATPGLLIGANDMVSIGPGSVTPIVPLQVKGQVTILDGAFCAFNNPTNTSTSTIATSPSNRMELFGPAGGGIDINGDTSVGEAVRISANSQKVFVAVGAVKSRAEILHGGVPHYETTNLGSIVYGDFEVRELASPNNIQFIVDAVGGHFAGDCDAFGTGTFAALSTSVGSVSSVAQVKIGSANPLSIDDATRKDYVDSGLASKLNLSGGAVTGTLQTVDLDVVGQLDVNGTMNALIVNAVVGNVSAANPTGGGALSSVCTTKGYVDAVASDIRLKTVLGDISPALDNVNKLKPFTFRFDNEDHNKRHWHDIKYGLSAQNVQIDFPHAVHHLSSDRDDEGNSISGDHLLGVDYAELVPVLIKAIQELTAKVEALENS